MIKLFKMKILAIFSYLTSTPALPVEQMTFLISSDHPESEKKTPWSQSTSIRVKTFYWLLSLVLSLEINNILQFFFFSQWRHPEEITPFLMFFKDWSREMPYQRENDLLYKFYILGSYMIIVAMGIILLLTQKQ